MIQIKFRKRKLCIYNIPWLKANVPIPKERNEPGIEELATVRLKLTRENIIP